MAGLHRTVRAGIMCLLAISLFVGGYFVREQYPRFSFDVMLEYLQALGIIGGLIGLTLLWQRTITFERKEIREQRRDADQVKRDELRRFESEVRHGMALIASEQLGQRAAGSFILSKVLWDDRMSDDLAKEIEQTALYMFKPGEYPSAFFTKCIFRKMSNGRRLMVPRDKLEISMEELEGGGPEHDDCIRLDTLLLDLWYSDDHRARVLARAEALISYSTSSQPVKSEESEAETPQLQNVCDRLYRSDNPGDPIRFLD